MRWGMILIGSVATAAGGSMVVAMKVTTSWEHAMALVALIALLGGASFTRLGLTAPSQPTSVRPRLDGE